MENNFGTGIIKLSDHLKNFKNLKGLELYIGSNNNFNDKSSEILGNTFNHNNFSSLSFYIEEGNQITDQGSHQLIKLLENSKNLEVLSLQFLNDSKIGG